MRHVRLDAPGGATDGSPGEAFFANLMEAWESTWPKPRVVVLSFPHNPTTECVDLAWMTRLVEFAREHDIVLVHDFAYADIAFDGYSPPSILQVPGAKEVAVELYTMTKSFSMAGWRVGFLVGNAEIVPALTKLKSYLDYGTFQPIQIAAIVAMNEAPDYPKVVNETYQARRDALCDGLNRIGWEVQPPRGTMFVWAPIPEPYREMGSLEFSKFLVQEADVATSPGVGFGPGGDGHVRFALIENEQRIGQGVRSLRRALTRLAADRFAAGRQRPVVSGRSSGQAGAGHVDRDPFDSGAARRAGHGLGARVGAVMRRGCADRHRPACRRSSAVWWSPGRRPRRLRPPAGTGA